MKRYENGTMPEHRGAMDPAALLSPYFSLIIEP